MMECGPRPGLSRRIWAIWSIGMPGWRRFKNAVQVLGYETRSPESISTPAAEQYPPAIESACSEEGIKCVLPHPVHMPQPI